MYGKVVTTNIMETPTLPTSRLIFRGGAVLLVATLELLPLVAMLDPTNIAESAPLSPYRVNVRVEAVLIVATPELLPLGARLDPTDIPVSTPTTLFCLIF